MDTTHEVELGVGNAAQLEDLDGRLIPPDAAGDAAKPIVEHARLALEMRYEGETPIARLMALVQASALPEESAQLLEHRLSTNAANEARVDQAAVSAFGGTVRQARERAAALLDAVEQGLHEGQGAPGGWQLAGTVVPVTAAPTVRDAVDNLVRALAGADGDAAVSFVRALHLTLFFDDDDDEAPDLF